LKQHDAKAAEQVLKEACAADPKSANPQIALGDLYILEKRPADAEAQFRRALALDPKSGPALMDLARLQLALGRTQEAEQNLKHLSELGEARYKPVYAEFLYAQGRRKEAVRDFEKLAKADPESRAARTRLVAAYRAVGRSADAEKVLDQALRKNPKDLDALMQQSEICLATGKYEEAQADLSEVLHLQPDSGTAHYLLAKLDLAQGDPLSYRAELSKALQLDPNLIAIRLELARSLIGDKQAPAALQLLDAAPASQKDLLPVLEARNWAVGAEGDLKSMKKGIDEGLARRRTPELLLQDGIWQLQTGKRAAARTSFEAALKLDPEDVRALSLLYESYAAQKQTAAALQAAQQYAAKAPHSAPVQEFLGTILLKSGQRDEARAAFVAAKTANPSYLEADFSLVQMDVLDKRIPDAQKRLKAILAAHNGNRKAMLWLGNLDTMSGNQAAALTEFRQVAEADPDNAQALNNLAYLLAVYKKKPDDALKYAQKAVQISPDDPNFLDTLGWVMYQQGLYPSAVQYLQQAVTNHGSVVSRYHLAMAYAKTGDLAQGRSTLSAALKLNPNLPEAKTAEQILSQPH
ncbi:MAG: tetratricopeptide repeat protein, partial [Bryobacteraceae bacterium]